MNASPQELCRRTVCIYKPGVPIPGVYCSFHYLGRMPCTGPLVCHMCGKRKEAP